MEWGLRYATQALRLQKGVITIKMPMCRQLDVLLFHHLHFYASWEIFDGKIDIILLQHIGFNLILFHWIYLSSMSMKRQPLIDRHDHCLRC